MPVQDNQAGFAQLHTVGGADTMMDQRVLPTRA
jgi:hypothetical protein